MKCKKPDCYNPPALNHVYCSRECAPYGNFYSRYDSLELKSYKDVLEQQRNHLKKTLKDLAESGLDSKQISKKMNLSYLTVQVYGRKWGIKIVRTNGSKKKKKGAPTGT